jgi:CBS domain-containing protein
MISNQSSKSIRNLYKKIKFNPDTPMSLTVEDVMTRNFVTIYEDCNVSKAAELMEEANVNYLVVMAENKLTGIITERDIMTRVVSKSLNPSITKVADIMTQNMPTTILESSLENAIKIMQSHNTKQIFVISETDGKLLGILSQTDFATNYSDLNSYTEMEKLTSKLGHDLFGQFGTIRNSVYIIEKRPENAAKFTAYINEAIDTSTQIIEALRSKTKKMLITQLNTDLDKFINSIIDGTTFPRKINLKKSINSQLHVNIDQLKMKRVIDNLLRNAADTMPNGGRLLVTTNQERDNAVISIISKSKSGETKTNIGMNFSKKIIDAHNGEINIVNQDGVGTVVEIKLPLNSI